MWGAGIHWSSVLRIIHKVLRLKCCKKRDAQQLHSMHGLHVLFCTSRDDNVTTSKQHTNSILESFEDFCQISSKLIHIISSYTVSKFGQICGDTVYKQITRQKLKFYLVFRFVVWNSKAICHLNWTFVIGACKVHTTWHRTHLPRLSK